MTESERRKIKRQLQNSYHEKYTHPKEKTEQIKLVLEDRKYFNILELFAGSGTTGCASILLNRRYILIEKDPDYIEIIKARVQYYTKIIKDQPLKI